MYQIIVSELRTGKHSALRPWEGRSLAQQTCRISALSSADFCLRGREEVDHSQFAFRGSKAEIRRLFEAEQLSAAGLEKLSDHKDYTVLFLGRPRLKVLRPCAG